MKKRVTLIAIGLILLVLSGCDLEYQSTIAAGQDGAHAVKTWTVTCYPETAMSPYWTTYEVNCWKLDEECDNKIHEMIDHFFGTDNNKRIYYTEGTDKAYILDVLHNDVRSEGMSYGMMICVQLNMRDMFDKLWKWAKTHMKQSNGFFAWQCNPDGTVIDTKSASDGEEWFAAALILASNRWGNTGTHNYQSDANELLGKMLTGGMFNSTYNLVNFQPTDSSKTDPSYMLPHFYDLFAEYGPTADAAKWKNIAKASRTFLKNCIRKSKYSLVPDYTDFSGNPTGPSDNQTFQYDAWRTQMNVVIDCTLAYDAWGQYGEWIPYGETTPWDGYEFVRGYTETLINFFTNQTGGPLNHPDRYQLNGTPIGTDHRYGLVAANAVATHRAYGMWMVTPTYLLQQWDSGLSVLVGNDRYYHGCLYMLSMLYCTGNFKFWKPGGTRAPAAPPPRQFSGEYNLTSAWSGKLVTVTSTNNNADVKCQPNNYGWSSQDWIIEEVPNSYYYRIKNVWSGKYLNVQNQYENAKINCYDLHPDWLSEQWSIEMKDDDTYRVRNAWSGLYLTVQDTSGYANMLAKSLNTGWASQEWQIGQRDVP